jgi:hypothetical protein
MNTSAGRRDFVNSSTFASGRTGASYRFQSIHTKTVRARTIFLKSKLRKDDEADREAL